jgi:hypothetical protein
MKKRKRGRPRTKEGVIPCWRFFRIGAVLSHFETERKSGQKHSLAVADTVQFLKQREPGLPISETEVKRTLAKMWPKNAETVGHFERSNTNEEDVAFNGSFREALEACRGKKGIFLAELPTDDQVRRATKFIINVGEKSIFPRHNGKTT